MGYYWKLVQPFSGERHEEAPSGEWMYVEMVWHL